MNSKQLKQIHDALQASGCQCNLKGAFIIRGADGITATCPECGVSVEIPAYLYTQPTAAYNLTAEEAAAVDAIRAHHAAVDAERQMAQHLLDTAAAYLRWLRANGRGTTFSTFCNEYEYQPLCPEMSRKPIYDAICELITTAREAAEKLAG